jgi:internalin A
MGGGALTDAGVRPIAALKQLKVLGLGTKLRVTNAGVKELAAIEGLSELYLQQTGVTEAVLADLAPLKKLTVLALPVTDAGAKRLVGFPELTTLDLSYSKLSDAGLKELGALKKLTRLTLRHTGFGGSTFTADGLRDLQLALPKCQIIR